MFLFDFLHLHSMLYGIFLSFGLTIYRLSGFETYLLLKAYVYPKVVAQTGIYNIFVIRKTNSNT